MTRAPHDRPLPSGAFFERDGATFYRLSHPQRMAPFLMTLASDTDLWAFISSRGGITAGRVDAEGALFLYETVDKLHDAHLHRGPWCGLRVVRAGEPARLWEPFAESGDDAPAIERHLEKSALGHQLVFEEVHLGLGLVWRQRWAMCEAFGLVRTVTLESRADSPLTIDVLDGLRDVLPSGVPLRLYEHSSCLVDAYKRTDADEATGLVTVSLTSRIIDQPEAAEELRASVVWGCGLPSPEVHLSRAAIAAFRRGEPLVPESCRTGERADVLRSSTFELQPGERMQWHVVADARRSHIQAAALRVRLAAAADPAPAIEQALREAGDELTRRVASADAVQSTQDTAASAHHLANVLFNIMRGGVFDEHHRVTAQDFRAFVRTRDRMLAHRHAAWLAALPEALSSEALRELARATADPSVERLALEYLPLHFGRRHGDPSRPWNRFEIRVRRADGSRALGYAGNWRDIFQNWEALCLGFPGFLPHVIARFVNATTVDGYNPYRLDRDGIDWEVPDPSEPWSHIGYWGDHQIVYLLRLLEWQERVAPGALAAQFERPCFAYADVPYRLRGHGEIVRDPHATIEYDRARAERIAERVAALGTDGRWVRGRDGAVHHATFLEKLLVPVLAKLSNYVADAGIWMNTQRPEWNDANNALVGRGVSTVTLAHLRRHLAFLEQLIAAAPGSESALAVEVADWLEAVVAAFVHHESATRGRAATPAERRTLLDALGTAYEAYRVPVYAQGFSGETRVVPRDGILRLLRTSRTSIEAALTRNRRGDGLYHAYHVLTLDPRGSEAHAEPLEEMLEGQVAALGSGLVGAAEAAALIDAMFASRLYREDQRSFMLYPNHELPTFFGKNAVSEAEAAAIPSIRHWLEAGVHAVIERDANGVLRFHADFRNAADLDRALDRLAADPRWADDVLRDRAALHALFESVFGHHAFTGRSGRMFAYEGLGSIYWHMVAKLLLSVQETLAAARAQGRPEAEIDALVRAYRRIRSGLGFEKSPAEYGAFPMDPYSHTPAHLGAQQPGMTGQVKEEILTRFGELGVTLEAGCVSFRPFLLSPDEFHAAATEAVILSHDGRLVPVSIPAGSLLFTFAQVPVLYHLGGERGSLSVTLADGSARALAGDSLDSALSRALLERTGAIARIEVAVPAAVLAGRTPNAELAARH